MTVIIVLVMIIILWAVYYSSSLLCKYAKKTVLGVTIPDYARNDKKIKKIISAANKEIRIFLFLFFIEIFPILLFYKYPSLIITYLFIWIFFVFFTFNRLISRHRRTLMNIKEENQWVGENLKTISIDSEVTRLKDTVPIKKKNFLIPFLISTLPVLVFVSGSKDLVLLFLSSISFLSTCACYIVYSFLSSGESVEYSHNTSVNLMCNRIRRYWSSCAWFVIAIAESLSFAGLSLFINNKFLFWNIFSIVLSVLVIFGVITVMLVRKKSEDMCKRILKLEKTSFIIDDDYYWKGGMLFYCNFNDRRVWVDNKTSLGYTCNLASRSGRLFVYLSSVLSIIIIVSLITLFLILDFTVFDMKFQNKEIAISAPIYGYSFSAKDIKDIQLSDKLPQVFKINGAATERYLLGNFDVTGYGSSKMYVYKEKSPFIIIELSGGYVFFGSQNPEKTMEYYEHLCEISLKK